MHTRAALRCYTSTSRVENGRTWDAFTTNGLETLTKQSMKMRGNTLLSGEWAVIWLNVLKTYSWFLGSYLSERCGENWVKKGEKHEEGVRSMELDSVV